MPGCGCGAVCGFTTCGWGKLLNTGPRGGTPGTVTGGAGRSSAVSSSTGGGAWNCGACWNTGDGGDDVAGRAAASVGMMMMRSKCDRLLTSTGRGAVM